MTSRQHVEALGRAHAGSIISNEEWNLTKILGSIPIYCRTDDYSVTPCLIRDGYWEAWITAWLLSHITADHIFLDVGANTGYYALIAAYQGARVTAFEPNPVYADLIEMSVAENHFEGQVDIVRSGVSDTEGEATLWVPKNYQGSATLVEGYIDEHYDLKPQEVSLVTLDSAVTIPDDTPLIIKIDTEGYEEHVWDGMQDILAKKPVIALEYTPDSYSDKFLDKLEDYGDLKWINFDGVEEPISREHVENHPDWVMLVIRPRN